MVEKKRDMKISEMFSGEKWKKIMRKDRLLIMLLAGTLLAVAALPVSEKRKEKQEAGGSDSSEAAASGGGSESYETRMEKHLEDILSQVKGVGKVRVMITLKESSEKIVEKDREISNETVKEEDGEGGVRTTGNNSSAETTVYGKGGESGIMGEDGEQNPYVTKEKSPVVEGVVVIAQGGDNAVAVQEITEAVQALFAIDTHKIKVMKLN